MINFCQQYGWSICSEILWSDTPRLPAMNTLIKNLFCILYFCFISQSIFAQTGLIQKASFPGSARRSASGFSCGKYGYLIGGDDGTSYKNDFWRYSIDSNKWTQLKSFPAPKLRDEIDKTLIKTL